MIANFKNKCFLLPIITIVIIINLFYFFWNLEAEDEVKVKSDDYFQSERQTVPWGLKKIGGPFNKTNENLSKINIAVIDSGVDNQHEDLKGQIGSEINFINPNQPAIDELGHGTAIAGVISAIDNNVGLIGVNPNVIIHSLKVLDKTGNGSVDDFVAAIEWCIENDIDVINTSFGTSKDQLELRKAIDKAIANNIIVVAAAGNKYGREVDFPAAYKKVISITAID